MKDIEFYARMFFPSYLTAPFSELHKWLFEIFHKKEKNKRYAIAAPRAHAKSTIISLIFIMWCISYNIKRYILIVSDTASQAQQFLSDIITEIETNSELQKIFPHLKPRMDSKNQYEKWTDSDIILYNGIKISARGTGAKLRGLKKESQRPDLIILDDCENDEMVLTQSRREKIETWFDKVVMNVGDINGCDIYVCGTILHFDSLLSKLIKRVRFSSRIFKAIVHEETKAVLWPDVWAYDKLMEIKRSISSAAFESEFQNNPVSSDTAIFKLQDFRYYEKSEIENLSMDVYFGVDLAISESDKANYTAIIVIGIYENNIYLLDILRKKIQFNDIIESIRYLAEKWKPAKIGIEKVAFQASVIQELNRLTRLPVTPISVSKSKVVRANTVSLYFQQHRVFISREMVDFIDELTQFPSGEYDDQVDAFVHAVYTAIYSGQKKEKKQIQFKHLNIKNLRGL